MEINFSFEPILRYGFSNMHLNAWVKKILLSEEPEIGQ